MRWASLVLTAPVVFYSAGAVLPGAWRDLRLRRVGMDVPVALERWRRVCGQRVATVTASGEVYFDSVTMFVFFLLGGRFLEMSARQKAVGVEQALGKLLPAFAARLVNYPASRETEQLVVADLQPGDVVQVLPGESVPADGVVLPASARSTGAADGRSRPVTKAPSEAVTGGAINNESRW